MTFFNHDDHTLLCVVLLLMDQLANSKKAMSKNEIQFSIDIPDKEPYEGKATMRQKKHLWDKGFKDQEIINNLGKQQASSIITQMHETYGHEIKKRSAKKMIKWAAVFLILSLSAKIGDFSLVAMLLLFLGVILLAVSGLRLLFGK